MSDSTFGLIELLLVFGVVIGWAVWELRSLEKAKRERRSKPPDDADKRS